MKIKKVITGGCSFSDADHKDTWPFQLENYIKNIDSNVEFEHLGMAAQGQELIQKKSMLAMTEALKEYKPEEIAVIVMWSGTTRKSFYISNSRLINRIISSWQRPATLRVTKQFADLKNNLPYKKTSARDRGNIDYNEYGGWYITRDGIDEEVSSDYYESTLSPYIHMHVSAENMIMLQNSCKANNVRFYQQYFMDSPYYDLELNKKEQLVGYLFDQIDDSTILLKQGMYEYLEGHSNKLFLSLDAADAYTYFISKDDMHPNFLGHKKWVDDIIVPRLTEDGFFK
jgi:hypothetical protein